MSMLLHFGKKLHPSKFSYLQIKYVLFAREIPACTVTGKDDKKLQKINNGKPRNFARQGTGSEKSGKKSFGRKPWIFLAILIL